MSDTAQSPAVEVSGSANAIVDETASVPEELSPLIRIPPEERNLYVVKVQPEREERIKKLLDDKIREHGMQEVIRDIFIPKEKLQEMRGGKKKVSESKTYPGYLFVDIVEWSTDVFFLITEINGISGFISADPLKPEKLPLKETIDILRSMDEQKDKPKAKVEYEINQRVRIKNGPFINYEGVVDEIYPEKGILKVSIHIFGRSTPVELEFYQVEKA